MSAAKNPGKGAAPAAPLVPAEVLDAFAPAAVAVAGRSLQPLTSLHYLALARFAPGVARGGEFTETDAVIGLLLLTTPAADLRGLMGHSRAMMEEVAYDLAARVPLADLLAWPAALAAHLDRAFAPALAARSDTEKKTASAGCSDSSSGVAPSTAGASATR